MHTYRTVTFIVIAGLTLAIAAGCKPGPIQKPLKTNPIEKGSDTVNSTRLMFQGQWSLVSLVVTNPEGRAATVEATGDLVSDAYGNLKIEYRISDAGLKALQGVGITSPNPVISTSGKFEVNPQSKEIRYVHEDAAERAFDPDLAAARANPFALERTRYYDFAADGTLRLATRYDNGKEAAVSRWKKGA
jgi:hypothetical protein